MASLSAIDSASNRLRDLADRGVAALRWEAERITARAVLIACGLAVLAIAVGVGLGLGADAEATSVATAKDISGPARVLNQLTHLSGAAQTLRVKCPECGVVESKREIVQGGTARADKAAAQHSHVMPVKAYEVTLRMKDGSSHRFVDANPGNWRPGQRIILIGESNQANE
jgi:hypothetical protein